MGQVINTDLRAMTYEAHLAALREHSIGLWDVVAEAHRQGSLDSAIRNRNENLTLPSSSPAYTLPYEDRAKLWLALPPIMRRFDDY